MAQKIQVSFEDDLDGSPAEGTVNFALDGQAYEIDLNAKHAAALRKVCASYIEHGRKLATSRPGRGRPASARPSRRAGRTDNTRIREWAKANGHQVSERGRISQEVVSAYETAEHAPSMSSRGVLAQLTDPAPAAFKS